MPGGDGSFTALSPSRQAGINPHAFSATRNLGRRSGGVAMTCKEFVLHMKADSESGPVFDEELVRHVDECERCRLWMARLEADLVGLIDNTLADPVDGVEAPPL